MDPETRRQLEEQLSAYLDGELTEPQRAVVEAFLAEDADARRLLDELKTTVEALKGLERAEASEQFSRNLRARLERRALLGNQRTGRTAPPPIPSRLGRWMAAAAVLALAFVGTFVTWTVTHQKNGPLPTKFALRDKVDVERTSEAPAPSDAVPMTPGAIPDRAAEERRGRDVRSVLYDEQAPPALQDDAADTSVTAVAPADKPQRWLLGRPRPTEEALSLSEAERKAAPVPPPVAVGLPAPRAEREEAIQPQRIRSDKDVRWPYVFQMGPEGGATQGATSSADLLPAAQAPFPAPAPHAIGPFLKSAGCAAASQPADDTQPNRPVAVGAAFGLGETVPAAIDRYPVPPPLLATQPAPPSATQSATAPAPMSRPAEAPPSPATRPVPF